MTIFIDKISILRYLKDEEDMMYPCKLSSMDKLENLDDDQGRAVAEYEICPRCGDENFFLACGVCNDGDDNDVNHLVADLENFVNFHDDDEIHVDLISKRDEFEKNATGL